MGGGINAWLCYSRWPVPVEDNPAFHWHMVPAGALHGAILALAALALASIAVSWKWPARIFALVLTGWLSGYVSWIALDRSVFNNAWLKSLTWPFHPLSLSSLWTPYAQFGLVTLLYAAWLLMPSAPRSNLTRHIVAASLAGALGSLWWWCAWRPWHFSILHGLVWGVAVGCAAWASFRQASAAS